MNISLILSELYSLGSKFGKVYIGKVDYNFRGIMMMMIVIVIVIMKNQFNL